MILEKINQFGEELRQKLILKRVRKELFLLGLSTDHYTDEELLETSRYMVHVLGQVGLTCQEVADTLESSIRTLGLYGLSDYEEKADG